MSPRVVYVLRLILFRSCRRQLSCAPILPWTQRDPSVKATHWAEAIILLPWSDTKWSVPVIFYHCCLLQRQKIQLAALIAFSSELSPMLDLRLEWLKCTFASPLWLTRPVRAPCHAARFCRMCSPCLIFSRSTDSGHHGGPNRPSMVIQPGMPAYAQHEAGRA